MTPFADMTGTSGASSTPEGAPGIWSAPFIIVSDYAQGMIDSRKNYLEPLLTGGTAGFTPDLQGMLYSYYVARRWDHDTGFPTKQKLVRLGLADVAAHLRA